MTAMAARPAPAFVCQRILLRGCVQGRGIRPIVARSALAAGLAGSVRNDMSGVIIEVGGSPAALSDFLDTLRRSLPPGAHLASQQPCELPGLEAGFRIEASRQAGPTGTIVPADRIVCAACLADIRSPGNRRYGYAFTSCTDCGPRYSILHSMPYDRQRTSMSSFEMCELCRQEYADPLDRRFHSQTNCCPQCGPRLWLDDAGGSRLADDAEAIRVAIEMLRGGRIVAVKGIGGYQLLCDATCQAAVGELRARKRRPFKPLAIMVRGLEQAGQLAELNRDQRDLLGSPAGPIVIARRQTGCLLAPGIHPGLRDVGVMLPTSPLHCLLLDAAAIPLVVTSGNLDGEPLEFVEAAAQQHLSGVADGMLHHDRQILRPIDDGVVRWIAGRAVTIRAGRGIAPIALAITRQTPTIALGGHQKVAIALSNGQQSILGPHLGDVDSVASRERYIQQAESLAKLYGVHFDSVVHDLHPDYFTTTAVGSAGARQAVQHHHAHIVSVMAEQGWLDQRVLGFAFDGTGFGMDGSIWGGEILVATADDFCRVGHLRPFALAGGEAAIDDPWRVAIALIDDALGTRAQKVLANLGVAAEYRQAIAAVLASARLSPSTTSMGRLFDGVAAIALDECRCSFEGEPAMLLESACEPDDESGYQIDISDEVPFQLDWRPLLRQLIGDKQRGASVGRLATRFHRGLATVVGRVVERFPELPVAFSGGVFQNRVLTEWIIQAMPRQRAIALPGLVPPNDGGLAAGQLAARRRATTPASNPRCA
jgi:hydrogenase maturation protein HypF